MSLQEHAASSSAGRAVFSAEVPHWPALATALATCSGPFVLFIAFDVAGEPRSELTEVASLVLQHGATYVCCWGTGCEVLHDAFDEAAAVRSRPPGPDGCDDDHVA